MLKLPEKIEDTYVEDLVYKITPEQKAINSIIDYLTEKEELEANGICPTCKADLPGEKKPCAGTFDPIPEEKECECQNCIDRGEWRRDEYKLLDILREKVQKLFEEEIILEKEKAFGQVLSLIDELHTK